MRTWELACSSYCHYPPYLTHPRAVIPAQSPACGTGCIVGIVVGVLGGLGALAAAYYFLVLRKRASSAHAKQVPVIVSSVAVPRAGASFASGGASAPGGKKAPVPAATQDDDEPPPPPRKMAKWDFIHGEDGSRDYYTEVGTDKTAWALPAGASLTAAGAVAVQYEALKADDVSGVEGSRGVWGEGGEDVCREGVWCACASSRSCHYLRAHPSPAPALAGQDLLRAQEVWQDSVGFAHMIGGVRSISLSERGRYRWVGSTREGLGNYCVRGISVEQ